MAFESDFLTLMGALVNYQPDGGMDQYGAPQFGTVVSGIPARIFYRNKIIRVDVEDRILSTAEVWCPPPGYTFGLITVPRIGDEDQVQLPDDEVWRHVLMVEIPGDYDGTDHHQKIALT